MPPDLRDATRPDEWLRRARSNLALARTAVPHVLLEDLCFEAQQAAGKAIRLCSSTTRSSSRKRTP